MKSQILKDKKYRKNIKQLELTRFILKQISLNDNFTLTLRWKALNKLINKKKEGSKLLFTNKCVKTYNRKTFNKLSNFSRIVFLKLIRSGKISGLKKGIW